MDWLFKNDNYIPIKDKNSYIDKSIFSILGTLSKIRQEDKPNGKGLYRLSPPVKFICVFFLIIFIALSRSFYFIILVDSYVFLLLSFLFIKDIKKFLTISFIVLLFTSVLLFPSVFLGNQKNSFLILLKIFGTVTSLNILSYTTKSRHITRSLKLFFIPDIFILIMDMTIKYIVILGDFSINMLYALKVRSIGKDNEKHTSLSSLIGVLFLKSKEMATETLHAMECRGFTENYKSKLKFKLQFIDLLYIFCKYFIVYFILLFLERQVLNGIPYKYKKSIFP